MDIHYKWQVEHIRLRALFKENRLFHGFSTFYIDQLKKIRHYHMICFD